MLRTTARRKLNKVMGPRSGPTLYQDTCRELGLEEIQTPNDSLLFGDALIAKGGILASVGRSIKIQAILFGAVEA